MAPAPKGRDGEHAPQTKQKTLFGFYKKKDNEDAGSSSSPSAKPTATASSSSALASTSVTPAAKAKGKPLVTPVQASREVTSSSVASKSSAYSGASSVRDTPPSSDATEPIDVDMIDDEGLAPKPNLGRLKRKAETDSEDNYSRSSDGGEPPSSPTSTVATRRRTKRPRPSIIGIDDDSEEDVEPVKKKLGKGRKSVDEDDFIAASGEESDVHVPSDNNASEDEGSVESAPKSKKKAAPAKSTKAKSSSSKSIAASVPSGSRMASSDNVFLTKAEQRVQDKKDDKKANEECYSFLKDVKDKEGRRPNDPEYDPRTIKIPPNAWNSFTPFEKQFWEIKQKQFDTILFFQKGKFFELYENDARIGNQEFDLKLTDRVKMCMVGVPESSLNFWVVKFLSKGYKVGKVTQGETALGAEMRLAKVEGKKKAAEDKIVRRVLNQVFTAGTLVDPDVMTDDEAGHCVSVIEAEGGRFGVCVLDCATGEFNMCAFEDDVCRTRLETVLRTVRAKELLHVKGNLGHDTTRLLKVALPAACQWSWQHERDVLTYEQTLAELQTMFPPDEDAMDDDQYAGFPEAIRGMLVEKPAIRSLGLAITYLRQLNIDKNILSMRNFNVLDPVRGRGVGADGASGTLLLDGQTLAHLEVLTNSDGTIEGSLLHLLGRCVTPFGKRLFRIWLCAPLCNVDSINARLDAVEDLIAHPNAADQFSKLMRGVPDLERLLARIHGGTCSIKSFLQVMETFKALNGNLDKLESQMDLKADSIHRLFKSVPDLTSHIEAVEELYQAEKDDLTPQPGKDDAFDAVVEDIERIEGELETRRVKLEKQLGTKVSYHHSSIGQKEIYIVEIKPGVKVPKDWTNSNSTQKLKRYDVPELQPLIRELKEARETRVSVKKEFVQRVFAAFDQDRGVWLRAVRMLAELDCLFSLAKASEAIGATCRPDIVRGDRASIDFVNLKHPALCLRRDDDFIPNDVKLGSANAPRVILLTGPNMGGKSTLMRMTAAGVIMAQLGMLVPADSARICPVDKIMTRMGAYDNMFSNSSTFKVEMDECCKILKEATPRSLVILDELGRGTSTFDGMAIAGAVLHELATHTLALSCFATHYSSLTDDYAYHPQICTKYMATRVDPDTRQLVFLYKLVDGVAEGSFGTHVASIAGVPLDVVERAKTISDDFAAKFRKKIEGKARSAVPLPVQADFAYLAKLVQGMSLPEDTVRQRDILGTIRQTISKLQPS
ncbi:DNA mismatch repair protein Msh6 [Auriculariales sp. MPI-PUGE-AT-0066]|nr:DNA mismatch repair protein Msh6 [Auriculariales sp. MPI-PUGE-AT-0066]